MDKIKAIRRMPLGRALAAGLMWASWWVPPGTAAAGEMGPTTQPLVRLEGDGWNLGGRLEMGRRSLRTGEELLKLDTRSLVFRAGARPLPFLHVWGQAGVAEADRLDADGSAGLAWAVGAGAALFEYVIKESPVVGVQESIGLELHAFYRVSTSDLPPVVAETEADAASGLQEDLELTWKDARVLPLFVYRVNRLGTALWRPYEPTGYLLRGGPVYARTTGDYGDASLREDGDFGAVLGFDVRFDSGWMGRVEMTWFGGSDRELALGVHRYF